MSVLTTAHPTEDWLTATVQEITYSFQENKQIPADTVLYNYGWVISISFGIDITTTHFTASCLKCFLGKPEA